jgi:hypothetical protein
VLNQDRRQKVDRAGEWRNRDLASRISVTLITLLRDAHPGAID